MRKSIAADFMIGSLAAGAMTLKPRHVSAQAGAPYRIGLLLPSTGAGANWMEECIRRHAGAGRRDQQEEAVCSASTRIEIVYRDDQTKPDVGAREARQLILNEKVNAIFGVYSSAVALGGSGDHPRAQDAAFRRDQQQLGHHHRKPHALHLPVVPGQRHAIGRRGRGRRQADQGTQLDEVRQHRPGLRVGPRHAPRLHYRAPPRSSAPEAKESKQLWFKLGETDFTSYISAIMAERPNFVYPAIAGKDNETFMQRMPQRRPARDHGLSRGRRMWCRAAPSRERRCRAG